MQQASVNARLPFHKVYNDYVTVWNEMHALALEGIYRKPPERCEWIRVKEETFSCWNLWTDSEYESFLYLLSNGKVARTGKNKLNPAVCDIRPVPRGTTLLRANELGRTGLMELRTLCQAMLTLGGNYNPALSNHPRRQFWHDTSDVSVEQYYYEAYRK